MEEDLTGMRRILAEDIQIGHIIHRPDKPNCTNRDNARYEVVWIWRKGRGNFIFAVRSIRFGLKESAQKIAEIDGHDIHADGLYYAKSGEYFFVLPEIGKIKEDQNLFIYNMNGYRSRKDYLNGLAEDYDVELVKVMAIAELLGPDEDFDGLISTLDGITS